LWRIRRKKLSPFVDLPRPFGDISGSRVDVFGLVCCTKNRAHLSACCESVFLFLTVREGFRSPEEAPFAGSHLKFWFLCFCRLSAPLVLSQFSHEKEAYEGPVESWVGAPEFRSESLLRLIHVAKAPRERHLDSQL
jgi:hypothetical protein